MFSDHAVDSRRVLYTPSSFARSSLLYLQETGNLIALKPHTSIRSGLESYLFFTVTAGSGELFYENQTYALTPGCCVLIDCRSSYFHRTGEELWHLEWAHFNGNAMPGIYEKYRERGGQSVFVPKSAEEYRLCLSELLRAAESEDYLRDMRINEKLSSLLTLIMESTVYPGGKEEPNQTLEELMRYLQVHWMEKISLEDLSARFYINKYYLTRIFRKRYGSSIGGVLNEKRITEAKRRLRFSADSIDDIARQCGFDSGNYFARIFKKTEGVTPGEYRKMWTV